MVHFKMHKKIINIKFEINFFDKLKKHLLQDEREQIAYLFCYNSVSEKENTFLPHKLIIFEPNHIDRSTGHVILPKIFAHELYCQFIESDYTGLINCHSHPFEDSQVSFSEIDDKSDKHESKFIFEEIPHQLERHLQKKQIFIASIVFGQKTICARSFDIKTNKFEHISKVIVLNDLIQYFNFSTTRESLRSDYKNISNRQILAFGEQGQKVLSQLKISVLGIGGVGSIIAEGLCRLGIRYLQIVDNDIIEITNLNRWQGAYSEDIGKFKVDVCYRNLKKYFQDIHITTFKESLFNKNVVDSIKNSDCVIGCLDNEESRYFLNRLSMQYLIPYIDGGVAIITEGKSISNIDINVSLVIPGRTRCLNCSSIKHFNKNQIHQFFLDKTTRNALEKEGYIQSSEHIIDPAVYPLNMNLSSFMLFEFLNLFTGFKEPFWHIYMNHTLLNKQKSQHFLGTYNQYERNDELCLNCNDYKGKGDSESLSYYYDSNKYINILGEL